MAEEKLTIVDVRKSISRATGVDESTAGSFLSSLINNITAGLKADQLVRIGGLGTFKLQWVEPRRSINISTGEPIIIDGYQKLGFTPDTSLREIINAPFAGLEAIVLDEQGNPLPEQPQQDKPLTPLQKLDKQALEIKDLLADIGQSDTTAPAEAQPAEPVVQENPEKPETPEVTEIPETPEVMEIPETPVAAETPESHEKQEEQEEHKNPEPPEKPAAKKEKPFRPWLVALITVLTFCLLLVAGYFYLQYKVEQWADTLNGRLNPSGQVAEPAPATPDATAAEPLPEEEPVPANAEEPETDADTEQATDVEKAETDSQPADTPPSATNAAATSVDSFFSNRTYPETKTTVTVNPGSRLTWIAKKQYGRKDFWIFIYEANLDKIKDPSNVKVGTELRIPKLPDEVMHPQDEEQLSGYIKALENKYLNK